MKIHTSPSFLRSIRWSLVPAAALLSVLAAVPAPSRAEPAPAAAAATAPATGAVAPETIAAAANSWEKDIAAFEASDKKNFPPADAALFVGSSSIRFWRSLAADFPEIPTIRRGFGGSYLSDTAYFADRIVIPYKPRLVVVYAGSNDLAGGRKPERVLASFQELSDKVHAALPATRIAFISINPSLKRQKGAENEEKTNSLIQVFVQGKAWLSYIDSRTGLQGADGQAQASLLRTDGLHLNADGYKKWVELVKPTILNLYRTAQPAVATAANALAPVQ